MKFVVDFSGGKDSTAMLLHMIELGTYTIDIVMYCDVGLEFPALYEHINKVKEFVTSKGIEFVTVTPTQSFEDVAFKEKCQIDGKEYIGRGFPRMTLRWCTGLKMKPITDYLESRFKDEALIHYVGLASDEEYRLKRNGNKMHLHPLVDWGWKEQDCLEYCYKQGYDFGGIYNVFDRVSCWCCPFQKIDNFKTLYRDFPELWKKLKEWEVMAKNSYTNTFIKDWTLDMFELRFELEDEFKNLGLDISYRTKIFKREFNKRWKDKNKL